MCVGFKGSRWIHGVLPGGFARGFVVNVVERLVIYVLMDLHGLACYDVV